MKAQYTETKGAGFYISKNPISNWEAALEIDTNKMLPLQYTAKSLTLTAPAGEELDVTVLGSPTKETIAGLPGESTVSNEANMKIGDAAQDLLRKSYDSGDFYAFVILNADGSKISFAARITNYDMSYPTHGISTGTFNYKLNGKFVFIPSGTSQTK